MCQLPLIVYGRGASEKYKPDSFFVLGINYVKGNLKTATKMPTKKLD